MNNSQINKRKKEICSTTIHHIYPTIWGRTTGKLLPDDDKTRSRALKERRRRWKWAPGPSNNNQRRPYGTTVLSDEANAIGFHLSFELVTRSTFNLSDITTAIHPLNSLQRPMGTRRIWSHFQGFFKEF